MLPNVNPHGDVAKPSVIGPISGKTSVGAYGFIPCAVYTHKTCCLKSPKLLSFSVSNAGNSLLAKAIMFDNKGTCNSNKTNSGTYRFIF